MLKGLLKFILGLLIVIAAGAVLLIFLIYPAKKLDMQYSELNVLQKVQDIITSPDGSFSMSEEELGNLIKKSLSEASLPDGFEIAGAGVGLENDQLHLYVNVRRGFLSASFHAAADIQLENGTLVITPVRYSIGQIAFSPEALYGLLGRLGINVSDYFNDENTIQVDLSKQMPPGIALKNVYIHESKLYVEIQSSFNAVPAFFDKALDIFQNQATLQPESVRKMADTLQKYSGNQISSDTINEITSGTITELGKQEIANALQAMDPNTRNQLFQDIAKQLDPDTLQKLKEQYESWK